MCTCDVASLCVLLLSVVSFVLFYFVYLKGMHASICKLFLLNNMSWKAMLVSIHNTTSFLLTDVSILFIRF